MKKKSKKKKVERKEKPKIKLSKTFINSINELADMAGTLKKKRQLNLKILFMKNMLDLNK